jgi:hypothetical protein
VPVTTATPPTVLQTLAGPHAAWNLVLFESVAKATTSAPGWFSDIHGQQNPPVRWMGRQQTIPTATLPTTNNHFAQDFFFNCWTKHRILLILLDVIRLKNPALSLLAKTPAMGLKWIFFSVVCDDAASRHLSKNKYYVVNTCFLSTKNTRILYYILSHWGSDEEMWELPFSLFSMSLSKFCLFWLLFWFLRVSDGSKNSQTCQTKANELT